MSKASEYAERAKAAENVPRFSVPQCDGVGHVHVTNSGELRANVEITPAAALRLATWIFETFGEGT